MQVVDEGCKSYLLAVDPSEFVDQPLCPLLVCKMVTLTLASE